MTFVAYITILMKDCNTLRFKGRMRKPVRTGWKILLPFCCKFIKVSAFQKITETEVAMTKLLQKKN